MSKVKVVTGTSAVTVETTATTTSQLLAALGNTSQFRGQDWKTVAIFQKDSTGRKTLSAAIGEEAVSQEAEYKLYITPLQMKAGSNPTRYSDAVIKEVKTKMEAIFADLLDEEDNDGDAEVTAAEKTEFDALQKAASVR
jgi:hypothetical protein